MYILVCIYIYSNCHTEHREYKILVKKKYGCINGYLTVNRNLYLIVYLHLLNKIKLYTYINWIYIHMHNTYISLYNHKRYT